MMFSLLDFCIPGRTSGKGQMLDLHAEELHSRELYLLPSPNERLLQLVKRFPNQLLIQLPNDLYGGFYPLHMALRYGADEEVIRTMVKVRPQCATLRDSSGSIPLHVALEHSSINVVKILLNTFPEGCRVADARGSFPLHRACCYDKAVRFVLRTHLDAIKELDNFHRSPLHNAIMCNASASTVHELVTVYPDALLQQDTDDDTPLHKACARVGHRHPSNNQDVSNLVQIRPGAAKLKNRFRELPLDKCASSIVSGHLRSRMLERENLEVQSDNQQPVSWEKDFLSLAEAYPEALLPCDDQHRRALVPRLPLQVLSTYLNPSIQFWDRLYDLCPLSLVSKQWSNGLIPLSQLLQQSIEERPAVQVLPLLSATEAGETPFSVLLQYTYQALFPSNIDPPESMPWFHKLAYCAKVFDLSSLYKNLTALEESELYKLFSATDRFGNNPVHAACMSRPASLNCSHSLLTLQEIQGLNKGSATLFDVFFGLAPPSAFSKRNHLGELPIHVYLKYQKKHYNLDQLKQLINACESLGACEDDETGLYPFVLAAVENPSCLDAIFYLTKHYVAVSDISRFLPSDN